MKQPVLTLFLLSSFLTGYSQNWQCVNANELRYFVNDEHYLRAIKIDSAKEVGTDTVLYPFYTIRGDEDSLYICDGNWFGKTITSDTNGRYHFRNSYDNDITIYSQATLNDSWIFYRDASNIYYEATVTKMDTMTVAKKLDSIKVITIIAKQGQSILNTDPDNGRQIILSKQNGFVQIFDLYSFPYRLYSGTEYFFIKAGGLKNLVFHFVNFSNRKIDVYQFQPGDLFEYLAFLPNTFFNSYITDEIISRTDYPYKVEYTIQKTTRKQHWPPTPDNLYDVIVEIDTLSIAGDTILYGLPETLPSGQITHYNENDTSFCLKSPRYQLQSNPLYWNNGKLKVNKQVNHPYSYYKVHLGFLYYQLIFHKSNDTVCGTYQWPASVEENHSKPKLSIYPNPSNDLLNIHIENQNQTCTIALTDVVGRVVYSTQSGKRGLSIPVNDIPAGIYNLQVYLDDVIMNERIVVQH